MPPQGPNGPFSRLPATTPLPTPSLTPLGAHLTTRTIPRATFSFFPFSPRARREGGSPQGAPRPLSPKTRGAPSLAPNTLIHAPLTAHAPTRAPFAASLFPLLEARAPKETRFGPLARSTFPRAPPAPFYAKLINLSPSTRSPPPTTIFLGASRVRVARTQREVRAGERAQETMPRGAKRPRSYQLGW